MLSGYWRVESDPTGRDEYEDYNCDNEDDKDKDDDKDNNEDDVDTKRTASTDRNCWSAIWLSSSGSHTGKR